MRGKYRKKFRRQKRESRTRVQDLASKVQFLVDFVDERGLLGEHEHTFTFPDGDTWWATDEPPR